jgi:outer membrane protein assembly factor BamD
MRQLRLINQTATACFFIICLLTSCSKHQTINTPPQSVEEQFESAMNDFQAKRYSKAIANFSSVIFNYPGSRYAADAQYFLALSNFEKKDYQQAIIELDFFIKNFPTSPYIEPALVKLALAYLRSAPSIERDQSQLLKTQEILEEIQEKYPDSKYRAEVEQAQEELFDRLAHKDYDAAALYFRAREYGAAKIYYQHILDTYPQTKWAAKAKLPLAICLAKTGSKQDARQLLEEIVKDNSNPELQRKASAELKKLD